MTKPAQQDKVQLPEEEWDDAEQKTHLQPMKFQQCAAVEWVGGCDMETIQTLPDKETDLVENFVEEISLTPCF